MRLTGNLGVVGAALAAGAAPPWNGAPAEAVVHLGPGGLFKLPGSLYSEREQRAPVEQVAIGGIDPLQVVE